MASRAGEYFCPACLLEHALNPDLTESDEADSMPPDLPGAPVQNPSAQPLSQGVSRTIGPYHLKKKLGEGGMGEVWLAEQFEPVNRLVAVKVIKPGMDTAQVISRFSTERQALALMNHRSIASVYDAGMTPRGRPYFAMEYVEGEAVTTYCDRMNMDLNSRLSLVQEICAGVQHAHQKGIIHRDLKPSNILVTTEDGNLVPKIIDFGVAKATGLELDSHAVHTRHGVILGTPEYMSPEQAGVDSEGVDTRVDVYALGVVFYELLCGALPFGSSGPSRVTEDELRRRIIEDEPMKPSAKLRALPDAVVARTARARGGLRPEVLMRRLKGELDWITLKAIAKKRSMRYGSANELAADIQRYLCEEPVKAARPSQSYFLSKFIRRHRTGVAMSSILMILMLGFAIALSVQLGRLAAARDMIAVEALRASEAAEKANREAAAANRVVYFLTMLFQSSDPGSAPGEEITARKILDRGVEMLAEDTEQDVRVRSRLLETMGNTYIHLGMYQDGINLHEQSSVLIEKELGDHHPLLARSLLMLASHNLDFDKLVQAEHQLRRALDIINVQDVPYEEMLILGHLMTGRIAWARGELEDSYSQIKEVRDFLAQHDAAPGRSHIDETYRLDSIVSPYNRNDVKDYAELFLAAIHNRRGEPEQALAIMTALRRSLEAKKAGKGLNNANGNFWILLGQVFRELGFDDEARQMYQRQVDMYSQYHGESHWLVAYGLTQLGTLEFDTGNSQAAYDHLMAAINVLNNSDIEVPARYRLITMRTLATTLGTVGRVGEGLQMAREAIELGNAAGLSEGITTFHDLWRLALLHLQSGDVDAARPLYTEVATWTKFPYNETTFVPGGDVVKGLAELSRRVNEAGDREVAVQLYEVSRRFWEMGYHTREEYADFLAEYAKLLRESGNPDRAVEQEARAQDVRAKREAMRRKAREIMTAS